MTIAKLLILTVMGTTLLFSNVYDIFYKRIPNIIPVTIVILSFTYRYLLMDNLGLRTSLYGLLTGFLVMLFFYRFTHLGAGDVKLIAAIGSFVGYQSILLIIAYSYVISAALGLIFIKLWLPWYKNNKKNAPETKVKNLRSERIPMAPGISLATFYVLYTTHF